MTFEDIEGIAEEFINGEGEWGDGFQIIDPDYELDDLDLSDDSIDTEIF